MVEVTKRGEMVDVQEATCICGIVTELVSSTSEGQPIWVERPHIAEILGVFSAATSQYYRREHQFYV